MPSAAHARRGRSAPRQVSRAGSGSLSTDERAEAEAEEREERQRRAEQLLGERRDTAGTGDDGAGGGGERDAAALGRFARRGTAAPAAEVQALLASGDLDHTLVLGGRVDDLLREQRSASGRLDARHAEVAALERTIGTRLIPDDLRGRERTWDVDRPRAWLERYAQGESSELSEARRRLAELRVQAADDRQHVERLRPAVASARREVLRRAQGEDIEVLLLATRRLREHGAGASAETAERALAAAREEHAHATKVLESDAVELETERDRIRSELGHGGSGGNVARHAQEEERLQRAMDEAAAPLAAVRGRMAELLMERDPRTSRRDRRLYARGSAKELLEGGLTQGRELRGSGGRAATTIGRRASGRTRELLAGGLSRVVSLTDRPRAGLARRMIGGEAAERRRRSDPETDGRSRRLPRRLRAQEARMARAHARAADAYARHMALTPQSRLLEQLTGVDERLHRAQLGLQRADRLLLDRLRGVRSDLTTAAARLEVPTPEA